MRIDGDFSVFVGAIIIWLCGLEAACQALVAGAAGDWPLCVFKTIAALCYIPLGLRVWRAA